MRPLGSGSAQDFRPTGIDSTSSHLLSCHFLFLAILFVVLSFLSVCIERSPTRLPVLLLPVHLIAIALSGADNVDRDGRGSGSGGDGCAD
jgi:hypothetical protein